jgi:O-antigen/teichoic acid export membrane protein
MFGMIFAGLLFPMFSRFLSEKRLSIYLLLQSAGDLLIGSAILIVFICIYNSDLFLSLIYDDYLQAIDPFKWLILSFIAICMNFIFGTLLTASGNLKILNWISFLGIVINVALNIFMIPKYGALGAAITTFVTQFFTAILQCIYAIKMFEIPISINRILKYPILILVLFLGSYYFAQNSYLIFFQLIIGISSLFLFSFISINSLNEMLNEKQLK